MKKVLLLLLLLFSLNIKVQASTRDVYYSDYSDFSEFSEVKVEESELVNVKSERRFRWYKNNITSEYLLYDEGINKYDLVNLEDYKLSEFSDWQLESPTSITGRTTEEKREYKVKKLKPIQSLLIGNFSFSKDKVNLGEIEIYVDNQKVNYDFVSGGSSSGEGFEESGFMMIDFYDTYYFDDIVIKFVNAEQEYINNFKIHAASVPNAEGVSNIYASYEYQISDKELVIEDRDFYIVNPMYEEEMTYDELPNLSTLDYVETITWYRYQDKYYYFYNTEAEYIDGYYVDYPELIKDENDYKDYYKYRTREKIVIENNMTITRYKQNLEDFIISTVDYELESNINYLENGVYSLRCITPFQVITKEVTVDIEENSLKKELEDMYEKYDNLVNDYNVIENKVEELQSEINVKNQELISLEESKSSQLNSNSEKYQQLLNDYNLLKSSMNTDTYINSLKEENQQCDNELNDMTLRNDDNEKKLKLSNQANDYLEKTILNLKQNSINIGKTSLISFVFVGLFFLLLVILLIKKMSSKK